MLTGKGIEQSSIKSVNVCQYWVVGVASIMYRCKWVTIYILPSTEEKRGQLCRMIATIEAACNEMLITPVRTYLWMDDARVTLCRRSTGVPF